MTYWGSGNITGVKSFEDITDIKDSEEIQFEEAMNKVGFGQGKFLEPYRNDLECF